ncbi:MAG: HEAT repeat domain-containing protein [Planctomycetes bacterium]|nr:HEAT repeat domain-containing protein [Planctomycetota bacterium]
MPDSLRRIRLGAALVAVFLGGLAASTTQAQDLGDEEFVTGAAAEVWTKWKAAMDAVQLRSNPDAAETALGELAALNPTPFRLALMAERSILKNEAAGGVLLFRQDGQAGSLKDNGKKIFDLLEVGDEQKNEADDGWYFASIGQFGVANANFQALIGSKPDPVALLEFADRVQRRHKILVTLAGDPIMGESVKGVMKLLQDGERLIKADPIRIKQNIERLAGPPRQFENSVARLKDSGEFSVPFLLQALRDPQKQNLTQVILRTLPQIGRPGLNPLVMGLRTSDRTLKQYVVRALGQIGYWQSVPYLLALRDAEDTPVEIRSAVDASLADLQAHGVALEANMRAADAFLRLAHQYYEGQASLAADARQDVANVWYWRDDAAHNMEVPTVVFSDIMTMRCCEEALRLDPELKPAISLWLAANFRRAADLPEGTTDFTRPDNYPSPAYFAQAAGASYCLEALAIANQRKEAAVALGAIAALRLTAGPASLVSDDAGNPPLADSLTFTDRMVRVRAALALGAGLPSKPFTNSQSLMTVLCEAVALQGSTRNALVVDADESIANSLSGALRGFDYNVVIDADLFAGLEKARTTLPSLDVIVFGSDLAGGPEKAVQQIHGEVKFVQTPILIALKKGDRDASDAARRADRRVGLVAPDANPDMMMTALSTINRAAGITDLTAAVATEVSLEATDVLHRLADTGNPLFRANEAESSLIPILTTKNAVLRTKVAAVLAYVGSTAAQEALAAARATSSATRPSARSPRSPSPMPT